MAYTKDRSIIWNRRNIWMYEWPTGLPTLILGGDTAKLTRTRTGESMPNYKYRIRHQLNATTTLIGTFSTLDEGNDRTMWSLGHYDLNRPAPNDKIYRRSIQGYVHPLFTVEACTLDPSVATNRAGIAFLKKCRAVQMEFSSPTFLGELRETLAMLRKPATGLRNIARSWLSKASALKKKDPKQWKKNLSSAWLEQAFGWTPLIHDVKSGYDAYRSFVDKADDEQQIVSGYGIEEKGISLYDGILAQNGFYVNHARRVNDKVFVKYKGAVVRRVDATLCDALARIGFDSSEFIPTAWELLPWSFLIDYFSNIGDVLTANAFVRADLMWVSGSTVRSRNYFCSSAINLKLTANGYGKWFAYAGGSPSTFTVSHRQVNRAASAYISPPSVSVEIPGNPFQWANMTALFAQANAIHPQTIRRR